MHSADLNRDHQRDSTSRRNACIDVLLSSGMHPEIWRFTPTADDQKLLLVVAALIIPFYLTCNFLRSLRAEMRRLFAISTSPLASLWTDTIDGVFMVRAFGLQCTYIQTMVALKNQDMKIGSLGWFGELLITHLQADSSVLMGAHHHQRILGNLAVHYGYRPGPR